VISAKFRRIFLRGVVFDQKAKGIFLLAFLNENKKNMRF
jgi:hypothetical protein